MSSLLLFLLLAEASFAQEASVKTGSEGASVTLGGVFQTRLSYGWTTDDPHGDERQRVGFGVRRARLQVTARVGADAGFYVQVDGATGTVQAIDAFAFYQPNDRLRLRLGRMASAQPRALILTSAAMIDAVDRPAIAEIWGARTIGGDGRDFGLDLHYRADQGEAILFLHNGDGNWDRARSNFRESTSGDVTGGVDRRLRNLAVSLYSALRPTALKGVELGGFVGYNGARSANTQDDDGRRRDYVSYAAHLYWGATPGSQPVRLKADVIGIRYGDQHTLGLSVLGAAGVHRAAEVFARLEQYLPHVNRSGRGDVFAVAGGNLSLSALRGRPYQQQRLTLGYGGRFPDDAPTQHLLVLQAQIVF